MLVIPDGNSYAVSSSPTNIPTTTLTVECWANPTSIQDGAGIIEFGDNADTGAFSIRVGPGQTAIATVRMNNAIVNLASSSIQGGISGWHHFALTVNPNDSIILYVNGIQVAGKKISGTSMVGSWNSLYFGHSGANGINFIGEIDEARIWKVVRTQSELISFMNLSLVGNESGLTHYYKFDDDPDGTFVHNFTGTGNEATRLVNAYLDLSTSPVQGPPPNGYMLGSKEKSLILPTLLCSSTASAVIHIFNRGDESIQIGNIGFQNGKVFSVSSTSGFPLSPGDTNRTALVNIQVNVPKPGIYSDTLIVPSTTICGGIVRIPVSIRRDLIDIGFEDTVFRLGTLLNCKLPLETQTILHNNGTQEVTITNLTFSNTAPIILLTQPPFTIKPGASQAVKVRILAGASQAINTTLTALAAECPIVARIRFDGVRSNPSFSIVSSIQFPSINLPPLPTQIDTTIFFKNTGTAVLSFNPPLSLFGSNSFLIVKPNNGLAQILPDSTLAITIRCRISECGFAQTTLHIQDTRNCGIDTLVPISINVLGPLLSTVSDSIDLGSGCSIRDTTITFKNESGRNVLIGNPIFSEKDVISVQNLGVLPKLLFNGDSIKLQFRFNPAKPGEYNTIVRFPLSPCGDKTLTFHSIYGVGKIILSDSVVDFGPGCDLSPQTSTIKMKNLTGRSVSVTDTTLSLSKDFTILSPKLPFVVGNGTEKIITIQFTPSVAGAIRGAITLYENGCYVTALNTKAIREHAKITANKSSIEFDTICPNATASQSITLNNVGLGDVSILAARIRGNSAFNFVADPLLPIHSGTSVLIPLSFTPNDTSDFNATLEFVFGPCNDTLSFPLIGVGGPKPHLYVSPLILDYGSVTISKDSTICISLTNPSCIPIFLSPLSLQSLVSPFSYDSNTLTDSISVSKPNQLCIKFKPENLGIFSATDTITVNNQVVVLQLKGKGVEPKLQFVKNIDFGDVQQGSSRTLPFIVSNLGDAASEVILSKAPALDFGIQHSKQNILSRPDSFVDSVSFTPNKLGVQSTLFVLQWSGHSDTVILRARGTGPGPLFSYSIADFGNVRVSHDSTLNVRVSAKEGFPITITGVTVSDPTFNITPTGTAFILSPSDTIKYQITYRPFSEVSNKGILTLKTATSSDVTLDLQGTGVEAHLFVTPDSIDFGNTPLRDPASGQPFTISNTGDYPLSLQSFTLHNPAFSFKDDPNLQSPLPPHTSAQFIINFKPLRAINYRDSAIIYADAPEQKAGVLVKGTGVFAPLGFPEITYALPDIKARVGDIVDIPVIISGSDISLIDIDSFYFEIHYDPLVVFFHDTIISNNTLSEGSTFRFTRLQHDSTIRISGRGKRLPPTSGILCTLRAEALLGQHDSSGLVITESDPINSSIMQSTNGSFVVTDCGNYRGGILFKGQYSLSPASPTPTTNIITIPFELGLAARVRIDLFDQLGRHIRTLLDADRGIGKHELVSHIGDLPSGEYYYVLESLEYRSTGKLFLTK